MTVDDGQYGLQMADDGKCFVYGFWRLMIVHDGVSLRLMIADGYTDDD